MEVIPRKRQLEGTTVACPIVCGSIAHWLGKKADETATHKWTLFVRGPNNEDLSTFVSQVAFTLHPSFSEPVRIVKQAPFEVSELGWGEFESFIRIYFKDIEESPVDIAHVIKLYYPPPAPPNSKKPVVSEKYDEIVFSDPSEKFFKCLLQYSSSLSKKPCAVGEMATVFDDSVELQQLTLIADQLQREIIASKARFIQLDTEYTRLLANAPPPIMSRTSSSGNAGSDSVSAPTSTKDKDGSSSSSAVGGSSSTRVKDRKRSNAASSNQTDPASASTAAANQPTNAANSVVMPNPPPETKIGTE